MTTTDHADERPRLMLTIQEAADQLAISRTLCYQLIKSGSLATVRIGRLNRVPADELADFVARLRRGEPAFGA
ncbi:helix-turn-helix domain-containing protein [Cellulomonas sp. NTE-D12]|uniref:helix-turn-helix domain-containing protein n=1 Tax=Cellulomonas sp. NTE-D12 TaxID=2962632 RepID=UPI0030816D93